MVSAVDPTARRNMAMKESLGSGVVERRGNGSLALRRERVQSKLATNVMSEITVFISYSHDSPDHREKVLALSEG